MNGWPRSRDDAVAPVKIARGAFNRDLPQSDLYVFYAHRFLVNGLLIPAGDVINGSGITRWTPTNWDVVEYLHVELKIHDVILANGAPAETLQGNFSRIEFDNFDEYVALYGAALTRQIPCAPIIARNGRGKCCGQICAAYGRQCDRRQPLHIIQDELAIQARRKSAA